MPCALKLFPRSAIFIIFFFTASVSLRFGAFLGCGTTSPVALTIFKTLLTKEELVLVALAIDFKVRPGLCFSSAATS